jgi:small-conductance mechanosensitive channel
LEKYLDPVYLLSFVKAGWAWLLHSVFSVGTLMEIIIIAFALLISHLMARSSTKRLNSLLEMREWKDRLNGRLLRAFIPLVKFILAILLLRIAHIIVLKYHMPGLLTDMASSLLMAWIIIKFSSSLLHDSYWTRLITILAWTVAALHIVNLLGPIIELLDQLAINFGGMRLSLLLIIKAVILFAVMLKLALGASGILEKRITNLPDLTPSVRVLLTKSLKVTLLVVAVMVALSSLGINLSAFAFIGGAIGVGVGFGLQKVVSNLISGVILLLDKSIKPGDVIEVGNSFGRIQSLGARYVSVVTRDGFEYLIPNEDLITQQVINWSFTNKLVRLKIGVGVSYNADVQKAMGLMMQAAENTERVLKNPKPVCRLKDFGDSSVDLELRIWISDPEKGVSNVSSDIRITLWNLFAENNIEIPFPQRDVHIKSEKTEERRQKTD